MEDLEDTQYFDEDTLPDVVLLDSGEKYYNEEVNWYVAEGGDNKNKNLSPPVHVDIPEYQVQKMNVDQLKENITKRKNLFMTWWRNFNSFKIKVPTLCRGSRSDKEENK